MLPDTVTPSTSKIISDVRGCSKRRSDYGSRQLDDIDRPDQPIDDEAGDNAGNEHDDRDPERHEKDVKNYNLRHKRGKRSHTKPNP